MPVATVVTGFGNAVWDETIIRSKLHHLAYVNKQDAWIQADLTLAPSSRFGRCLWKLVAKRFDCLRESFYSVDLRATQNILNRIAREIPVGTDLVAVFDHAADNFEEITHHHYPIMRPWNHVEPQVLPWSEDMPIQPAIAQPVEVIVNNPIQPIVSEEVIPVTTSTSDCPVIINPIYVPHPVHHVYAPAPAPTLIPVHVAPYDKPNLPHHPTLIPVKVSEQKPPVRIPVKVSEQRPRPAPAPMRRPPPEPIRVSRPVRNPSGSAAPKHVHIAPIPIGTRTAPAPRIQRINIRPTR